MAKFVEYVVMGLGIGMAAWPYRDFKEIPVRARARLILASGVAAILAGLLGHSLPHIGVG